MAESGDLLETEGVRLFCGKQEEKENDSSVFGRLESSTTTPSKRRRIEETKGKPLDESFVLFNTLSRLRQGLTLGRRSLKRTSHVGSSPSIRRSGVAHPGSRSIFRSSHGSLTLRWRNSFKRNFRQSVQDYSLAMRSTPRQAQLLAACSYSPKDKENEKMSSLQQNIRQEMKMAEGAAKLLAASLNQTIALEAGLNFLVSNARLDAYLDEFCRQNMSTGSISEEGLLKPCPATVTISDLRIPLVWKDEDNYLSKDDRCAAFCLLRIGSTVYNTRLLADVDRNTTELAFDDVIALEADNNRFECSLEVYVHRFCAEWKRTYASQTPLRAKFGDVASTTRNQLSGFSESEEGNNLKDVIIGPKFERIAKATLTLNDVDGAISCYDLVIDPESTSKSYVSCGLALFGNFCCCLSLEPQCLTEISKSGWLNIQTDDSDRWPFWCYLEGNELLGWSGAFESKSAPAQCRILLTQDVEVTLASDDDNSEVEDEKFRQLVITVKSATDRVCRYELTAESRRDVLDWKHSVLQRICDCSKWKNSRRSFIEKVVDTPKSKTVGPNFLSRKSYSQTLLNCDVDSSPMTRFLTRLNIDIDSPDLGTGLKVGTLSAMRESCI